MSDDPKSKIGDFFPESSPLPGMLKETELGELVSRIHACSTDEERQALAAPLTRVALTQVTQELLKNKEFETCLTLLAPLKLLSPRLYRVKFIALVHLERHKEALKAARKVLANNPDDHDVRDLRADCYEKLGRHVEALNERILSQRERSKQGHDITLHNLYLLRASYQLRINEPTNARGSLELAEECNDPSSESYFLSAEIAFAEKDYFTAVEDYSKALEMHSDDDDEHPHFKYDLAVKRLAEARAKLNPPRGDMGLSGEFPI